MTRTWLAAALAASTAFFALPALAQDLPCAPRDEIVASITADFGEEPKAMGLQQGETLMEIFASERTGSFTVLETSPDGTSCVVAMGSNWTESLTTKAEQKVSF